jgi:hypothetical protein
VYAFFHSSSIQTSLVSGIAGWLSGELKTEVSIGSIDLEPLSKLVIKDLMVRDLHQDTLIYVKELKVKDLDFSTSRNKLFVNWLSLKKARINLIQYPGEEDMNFQFIADYFDSGQKSSGPSKPFLLSAEKVIINDADFSYDYRHDTNSFYGVDFNHIHTKNLNGIFSNLDLIDDSVNTKIELLSLYEKSGFNVYRLTGDFGISGHQMSLKGMVLSTNNSYLRANLKFKTRSWDDYNDFEDLVYMDGMFSETKLEFRDISWFTSELKGIRKSIQFKGHITGPVVNLRGRDMDIRFGSLTRLRGDVSLKGLPDVDVTRVHMDVHSLNTCLKDLEGIPLPPFTEQEYLDLPSNFALFGEIGFSGVFDGYFHDFRTTGEVNTEIGYFVTDIGLKQEEDITSYEGKITATDFRLGFFYDQEDVVGNLSADLVLKGTGITVRDLNMQVSGAVSRLDLLGYGYSGIKLNGLLTGNSFEGDFSAKDEHIDMQFKGVVDFSERLPAFRFNANVARADLADLKFLPKEMDLHLITNAEVDFKGDDPDNISGSFKLANTVLSGRGERSDLGNLVLLIHEAPNAKHIELNSDVLNLDLNGKYTLSQMDLPLRNVIGHYLPNLSWCDSLEEHPAADYSFSLHTGNIDELSRMFLKDVEIEPNTRISGSLQESKHELTLQLDAPFIRIQGKDYTGVEVLSNTADGKLNFNAALNTVALSDSSRLDKLYLTAGAGNNLLNYAMGFKNNSVKQNYADIAGSAIFVGKDLMEASLSKADLMIEDTLWRVSPDNEIRTNFSRVTLRNMIFRHDAQEVLVESEPDLNKEMVLNLRFRSFQLGNINPLLRSQGLSLGGVLEGAASFSGFESHLVFTSSLSFTSLTINQELVGDGSVVSVWNTQNESISVNGRFMRGQLPTLAIRGFYYPNRKEDDLDFEINLQKTQLKLFEQYVTGIFSEMKGFVSGDLFLSGSSANPILKGELDVMKGGAMVDYINTAYSFNGKVAFSQNRIELQNIAVFDAKGQEASVSGSFTHDYFRNIRLDLYLVANSMMCLNTTETMNSLYYGTAYASGQVRFHGDLDHIRIDIVARTEEGTQINIPLSGPEEITETGMVRFVKHDVEKKTNQAGYKVDMSGIAMTLELEVTPAAEVKMIFDSKIGDIIQGTGKGNLKMAISPTGDFSMYGDYQINTGSYLFTLQNVINKKFRISEGGLITWTGDPYNADINLEAVYRLRTSLYDVLPSDSSKQRVPVECKLRMTEKLMNPNIKFDIDLPNTDDRVRNDVRSAINISNETELNKQVFSLLMLGRFFPPSDRPTSGSLGLSQNTSELLSSQLSNWLSQTNEFVNLGVRYQAGDQITSQELQLAMSTQLFNERLSIDGQFGVTNNPSRASNLIGDVNVDYKINADGRFRVKAYNQTNDNMLFTNQGPYRQGLGVFYREEFDSWNELMKMYSQKMKFRKNQKAASGPDSGEPLNP